MTKNMLTKWLENRGLEEHTMKTSNPDFDIEFEFFSFDLQGNYLPPEDRTFDRVNIIWKPYGAIFEVAKSEEESMDNFLKRVARKFNSVSKDD